LQEGLEVKQEHVFFSSLPNIAQPLQMTKIIDLHPDFLKNGDIVQNTSPQAILKFRSKKPLRHEELSSHSGSTVCLPVVQPAFFPAFGSPSNRFLPECRGLPAGFRTPVPFYFAYRLDIRQAHDLPLLRERRGEHV
jgi:hypothetical protein